MHLVRHIVEESFFVRRGYFRGVNDAYSALKTTLKAEINSEAWAERTRRDHAWPDHS